MFNKVLKSKIHRATVTHADLDYEGSITLPGYLLEAAELRPYEAVSIWNVTNGNRFETYTMLGDEGTNHICINGAAAHLAKPGDIIIIACFSYHQESELADYEPTVVFVDQENRAKQLRSEVPGPELIIEHH